MYVCTDYLCVFLLLLSVYVGATPTHGDPTPRGGMAGASTPGGTPFRDKLNINVEEQALFDEAVPIKKQQVRMYVRMYVLRTYTGSATESCLISVHNGMYVCMYVHTLVLHTRQLAPMFPLTTYVLSLLPIPPEL